MKKSKTTHIQKELCVVRKEKDKRNEWERKRKSLKRRVKVSVKKFLLNEFFRRA